MQLYFLRHAEASYDAPSDHDRPLTQRGIDRTQNAARVIKALDIDLMVIYSSPRVRARQTAEIVAEAVGLDVVLKDEVNFNFSISLMERLIAKLDDDSRVLFVGHNPSMSEVVSDLSGADIDMKKGALVRIDRPVPGKHDLKWVIPPGVFDTIVSL